MFFIIFRHFLKEHYEGKIFECDWSECGAVFKKETNLQHHKYIHREQERKCEVKTCKLNKVRKYFHNFFQVCDEIFQRRSSFYNHWKEKHFETHGLRSVWLQSMGKSVEKKKNCVYPRKRLLIPSFEPSWQLHLRHLWNNLQFARFNQDSFEISTLSQEFLVLRIVSKVFQHEIFLKKAHGSSPQDETRRTENEIIENQNTKNQDSEAKTHQVDDLY